MPRKYWQRDCKTLNCSNTPSAGQDYCASCWKLVQQLRLVPDPAPAQHARDRQRAAEDAATDLRLGA